VSVSWSRVRLDECCEIVSGATPSTTVDSFWGGEVCWATPKDLSELEGSYISDTPRKLTQAGLENCSAAILPPGSVLFSSRAPIGHVAVNTVPMATNQGFKSFVPKKVVAAKFLYWWLKANRGYLESLGNGATFKEVSKAIVSRIEIPLPPLSEQRRIADVLDRAEVLRVKRRAALAELDELTQSIFLDMFGDPATNPKGWPVLAMGNMINDVSNGMTRRRKDTEDGRDIVLRLRDIRAGWIDFSEVNRITLAPAEIERYRILPGNLLFIRVNGNPDYVGRCALFTGYNEPVFFNDHVMRVDLKEKLVDGIFVTTILNSHYGKRQIASHRKTSAGQHTINQEGLGAIRLPLPPLALQRQFAARVAAVERLKAAQRASLAELDELFASLQHRAFRGEL